MKRIVVTDAGLLNEINKSRVKIGGCTDTLSQMFNELANIELFKRGYGGYTHAGRLHKNAVDLMKAFVRRFDWNKSQHPRAYFAQVARKGLYEGLQQVRNEREEQC